MFEKPYVYVTRKLPDEIIKQMRDFAEVGIWDDEEKPVPREVLLKEAEKADGLLTMLSDRIDEELLSRASRLKVVANLAVGYDNIDVDAANKYKVKVCNTPDILTDTTADLTFSLMLMAGRRLLEAAESVKAGEWNSWSPLYFAGTDVHHKTIGIVGMGKIGEALAKRANGFGMKIVYYNRNRKHETEKELGAVYLPFEELVQEADYVVSLTPLTEETKGMFTKEIFKKMKPTAFFINAGRGAVAVEEDLVEALKNGDIAGAGLDVFEKEPIDKDHPLLKMKNVVALPHIGSASVETRMAMMYRCSDNIQAVLYGNEPISAVN